MDDLKRFPTSKLKPASASFGGRLAFNPYCELPPTIWYGIGIALEPFDLEDCAPDPDLWGTTIDTTLSSGGIILPFRDWKKINGELGPIEDVGEGSIYVSGVHNPVDIRLVRFKRIGGTKFRINLDLEIAFEFEGSGFSDTRCSLEIEPEYSGLSFYAPIWNDPDSVEFPNDWKIPENFDKTSVQELFERFVDTSLYDLNQDGKSFKLLPRKIPTEQIAQQDAAG